MSSAVWAGIIFVALVWGLLLGRWLGRHQVEKSIKLGDYDYEVEVTASDQSPNTANVKFYMAVKLVDSEDERPLEQQEEVPEIR